MPYFSPKRVLITGGAGFIGSHVAILFATKYPHYKIFILDKLDYCSNTKNLSSITSRENVKFIKGDILSTDLITYLLNTEKIDTVLHFAANSHVDASFGNSFEFTENNIKGTHALLETVKTYGHIKRFIHVSTDEVYGETSFEQNVANVEAQSLLEPTNPYSATKAAAEMLVMAYGRSYNVPYIITRGNNVYGPHQYPEKAIPKFILLARQGKEIPIHGDGLAKRSYLHVSDTASAFDIILHEGKNCEVYNIGTSDERSVLSIARDVVDIVGDKSAEIIHVEDRKFNDRRYFIDCNKLISLGWSQKVTWDEGLRQTIEWYSQKDIRSAYWGDITSSLVAHPLATKPHVQ